MCRYIKILTQQNKYTIDQKTERLAIVNSECNYNAKSQLPVTKAAYVNKSMQMIANSKTIMVLQIYINYSTLLHKPYM